MVSARSSEMQRRPRLDKNNYKIKHVKESKHVKRCKGNERREQRRWRRREKIKYIRREGRKQKRMEGKEMRERMLEGKGGTEENKRKDGGKERKGSILGRKQKKMEGKEKRESI